MTLDEYEAALVPYFGKRATDVALCDSIVEAVRIGGGLSSGAHRLICAALGVKSVSDAFDAIKKIHAQPNDQTNRPPSGGPVQ